MPEKLKYALAGACAGALNGFLGAGGGVILVPLLLYWIKLEEKKSFATSVFIIFPISIVSLVFFALSGRVQLLSSLPYIAGGLIGGFIGGKIYPSLPVSLLRRVFGALLIIGGARAVLL